MTSYVKRLVCLAVSAKVQGYCVAGRELLVNGQFGGWIRPVSDRPDSELNQRELRLSDGGSPQLLDILEVPLLQPVPRGHQSENHLIDPARMWRRVGNFRRLELSILAENRGSLWANRDSTRQGIFDCISVAEADGVQNSLILLKKRWFQVKILGCGWNSKRKYRGEFIHNDTYYSFSLTDPIMIGMVEKLEVGSYEFRDVYLCISLTEPFHGDSRCHKLVASVIAEDKIQM